jgi:aspartate-semialdehyde dehydrogenase
MKKYNIAVAGATGAVGQEMLKVLSDRNFPINTLKILASKRSVGKEINFKGETLVVEELSNDSFAGIDIALFSAGSSRSKEFRPACVDAGAIMIDNSSAFRMEEGVPLVVPEVNPEAAQQHQGVIANPNCSTIQMVVALNPIHQKANIERVVVATYQAASGAGAAAMQELIDQTKSYLNEEELQIKNFVHQIAFNLIPHIDVFQDNGYTKEEMKMVKETQKIMSAPEMKISATTVRVPVLRAHSEAINIQTSQKLTVKQAKEILAAAPGLKVVDDPAQNIYPMPKDATGQYETLVGRIREDISQAKGLDIFVCADQLLKGAALNAIQIAELLI